MICRGTKPTNRPILINPNALCVWPAVGNVVEPFAQTGFEAGALLGGGGMPLAPVEADADTDSAHGCFVVVRFCL